jgi:TRAP-type uncharacterized transport system fused permease subunit
LPPNNSTDYVGAITKVSPPVSVSAMALAGVSLQDWVLILTAIYTVLQIGWFIYSHLIKKTPDGSR